MLVPVCPSQCRAARAGITSSSLSVVTDSDIVRRTIGRVCAGGGSGWAGLRRDWNRPSCTLVDGVLGL